mmetsp:Transcript_35/g.98  ORF Transcript_35/g.98 Transcript_35/m.98 type:complete len:255 (-) Transcript_35:678-1442(-)
MSDAVMSPGADIRYRSMTVSCGSEASAALTASHDPEASALRMMFMRWSTWSSDSSSMLANDDKVTMLPPPAISDSLSSLLASSTDSAAWRARLSDSKTSNTSPACGTLLSPSTWAARDGPISDTSPEDVFSDRTLPKAAPAAMQSPTLRCPFWTMSVVMGPDFLSRQASSTVPVACRSGLATRSSSSATSNTVSSSSSTPVPFLAEMFTMGVLPPHSSGISSTSVSSCLTRSGLAPSLSILLIATTIGTPAALA